MAELIQIETAPAGPAAAADGAARPRRIPEWLTIRLPRRGQIEEVSSLMRAQNLVTVCEEARCPNLSECWSKKTATFMILGDTCTRSCRFCAVKTGKGGALDPDEPRRVAESAGALGLKHTVVTSVNRDELPDGGARHFAETIRQLRELLPDTIIEVLTPDFLGNKANIQIVVDAKPQVYNHNVETVPRLYRRVRPQARYPRSLQLLQYVKRSDPGIYTKSGFMVGLGETREEVETLLRDLQEVDVDVATIGQYLQPTRRNLPVEAYVDPAQFDAYRDYGLSIGFKMVFSGPLVRSSYMAEMVSGEAHRNRN